MGWRAAAFCLLLAACGGGAPEREMIPTQTRIAGPLTLTSTDAANLSGWAQDDLTGALDAFRVSCAKGRSGHEALGLSRADWAPLCAAAASATDARAFFADNFTPTLIETGRSSLITGYYEPELLGSRTRRPGYDTPLHAVPEALGPRFRRLSRERIVNGALDGKGLELFWVADPVEAFFLQIQGSGRIRLPDGGLARVGYGGQNGMRYVSVGRLLVEDEVFELEEVTAQKIKDWIRANGPAGVELMNRNPSYVFFRDLSLEIDPTKGPLGALEAPLTPLRSIAVDRRFVPLGAPVWVEVDGGLRRLMIAQDIGGAIKGPQRGDIFFGSGEGPGRQAGDLRATGRLWAFLPRKR